MNKIVFNDGYKTYQINDDENAIIKVMTTDLEIQDRYVTAIKRIEEKKDALGINNADYDVDSKDITILGAYVKEQIDYIFNSPVSDTVFKGTNLLSPVDGKFLFEHFLDAIIPEIVKDLNIEAKKIHDRTKKYTDNTTTKKYKKPVKK